MSGGEKQRPQELPENLCHLTNHENELQHVVYVLGLDEPDGHAVRSQLASLVGESGSEDYHQHGSRKDGLRYDPASCPTRCET